MDVQSRTTEYVEAVAKRTRRGHDGPLHLVASVNKDSGHAKCGADIDKLRHVYLGTVPWVEATCRACREAHLREKQRTKAGWWGRSA